MTDYPSLPEGEHDTSYAYRPSVLGAGWHFTLHDDGIVWQAGRRSDRLAYGRVHRVRMSFRPVSLQSYRFMTELWADNGAKLKIVSTSWKGPTQQERLDADYVAFITELHRRIVRAGAQIDPQARFEQGVNPVLDWTGVFVFVAVSFALAALITGALRSHVWGGAVFVGAFLAAFTWQAGNYIRRNRPRRYHPDVLPPMVMPKIST